LVFQKEETFVGVEQRMSAAASPTNELGKTLPLNLNMPAIITKQQL
jgi:hypothetical protein